MECFYPTGGAGPQRLQGLVRKGLGGSSGGATGSQGEAPIPRWNEEMGDGQAKGEATLDAEAPDPKTPGEEEAAAEEAGAQGSQSQEVKAGLAQTLESAKTAQAAAKTARTTAAAAAAALKKGENTRQGRSRSPLKEQHLLS